VKPWRRKNRSKRRSRERLSSFAGKRIEQINERRRFCLALVCRTLYSSEKRQKCGCGPRARLSGAYPGGCVFGLYAHPPSALGAHATPHQLRTVRGVGHPWTDQTSQGAAPCARLRNRSNVVRLGCVRSGPASPHCRSQSDIRPREGYFLNIPDLRVADV